MQPATLARVTQSAQFAANRDQQPYAILNLNTAGAALYVIRDVPPDATKCVAIVHPAAEA